MVDKLWTELSGASGVALACCFMAAAVALRWSGRRRAKGAWARARQRRQAALESMDKAAQRFRLQVTVAVVEAPGGGTPSSTYSCLDVWRGRWKAAQVCGLSRFVTFGTPLCPNSFRILSETGGAKGRRGKERDNPARGQRGALPGAKEFQDH